MSEKSVCQHFDKYAAKANFPQNGCEHAGQLAKVLDMLLGDAFESLTIRPPSTILTSEPFASIPF